MENNNDIISENNPENKKTKIFILCGVVAVLIVATIFLVIILSRKGSSEETTEITTEEVVKSSGYTELLNRAGSGDEANLFSKIEKKIVEDSECHYGCPTGSESESEKRVGIFYQDSFFDDYDYGKSSLINETLANFFSSVFPEYETLAYVDSTMNENEFFVLSDNGDVYRVNITASGKGVSIRNQAGTEIFQYSGRLVAPKIDDVVVDETDFIDEENLDEELEEELEILENE